ncbi:hypothetical protein BJI67_09070 [Acidihalobacter aeolianus]|uniref:SH3b domain-containing protein n=2 Tax=Acidihalobacter aeolianus TaxID=2792603 RepID=A0A1D8K8B1_9GAMM|nr:hypothetical protein BJI67_09070 [Acidihalobacter aeolianus]
MYVTDQIKVTVRSGPGLQYQILKMVGTGDRVSALKTTSSGYTEVKLGDGTEGWVLSRYLMANEPAAMRLATLNQTLTGKNQALSNAQKALAQSQTELTQTQKDKQQLQSELASLTQKYRALAATSQNAVAMQQANSRLQALQKSNQQQITRLTRANATLSQHSRIQWFLAGSGVLLGGLILGLLLPKLARRRKDSWFN